MSSSSISCCKKKENKMEGRPIGTSRTLARPFSDNQRITLSTYIRSKIYQEFIFLMDKDFQRTKQNREECCCWWNLVHATRFFVLCCASCLFFSLFSYSFIHQLSLCERFFSQQKKKKKDFWISVAKRAILFI